MTPLEAFYAGMFVGVVVGVIFGVLLVVTYTLRRV